MRHGKKFNKLGRKAPHRRSLLKNQAISLIKHKRIRTTTAKAKALRKYIEPILTKSKIDSTNSRRVVFSKLQDKEALKELFDNISNKISSRPGGYTRVIKDGYRYGDNSDMSYIELVDYSDYINPTNEKSQEPNKATRRRRKTNSNKSTSVKTEDETSSVKKEQQLLKQDESLTQEKFRSSNRHDNSLQLTENMFNMYITDPKQSNVSEETLSKAIDKFYEHRHKSFTNKISVSPKETDTRLIVGKPHTFVVSIEIEPNDSVDQELLEHFLLSLSSFEVDFENDGFQNLSFVDNSKHICEFVGIPTSTGDCEVLIDCWQNSSHFLEQSLHYSIEPR